MNDLDLGIKQIGQSTAAGQHGRQKPGDNKKRRQQGTASPQSTHELAEAVEGANKMLADKNSPYQFRMYSENTVLLIDLVRLDERGEAKQVIRRGIPQHDIARVIEHLGTMDGLIVDLEA